jgi:hypothetical protein
MTRQAARRHQHQVESKIEAGKVGTLQQKGFGGAGYPTPLARQKRNGRRGELAARLNLDDREHLAAPCHNIDLAGRAAPAASQDMPSAQPQKPEAKPFRRPPPALRASAAKSRVPPGLSHSLSSRMASARR